MYTPGQSSLTWLEFKRAVEEKGLKDDDMLDSVHYGGWSAGDVRVAFEEKPDEQGRRHAWVDLD